MEPFSFLILFTLFSSGIGDDFWRYREQPQWSNECRGSQQSPIQVTRNNTVNVNLPALTFSPGYNQPCTANMTNTGHTIEVKLSQCTTPTVSGGGLKQAYRFSSIHFHWSAEHILMNNVRYPLEAHLVHYSSRFTNIQDALEKKDGIAVLAVFYNTTDFFNTPFYNLIDQVKNISHRPLQPVVLEDRIVLRDFLPVDTDTFYRYTGSLTTPNCVESVIWTLFPKLSTISAQQLKDFTKIWTIEDLFLRTNYRRLQSNNGRRVLLRRPRSV